jgi:hypothetical protein
MVASALSGSSVFATRVRANQILYMPLSRATMPSSGMTWRTSCRMRYGVTGQRSSVLAQRRRRGRLQLASLPVG